MSYPKDGTDTFATTSPSAMVVNSNTAIVSIPEYIYTSTPTSNIQLPFPTVIEDPILAEVVQIALTSRVGIASFGGELFCSYALLVPLQISNDGKTTAYTVVACSEFYVQNGVLQRGTSLDIPIALTLEEWVDGWNVEIERPKVGNWGPSIREIFPPETWPLIFASDSSAMTLRNALYTDLFEDNIQQAVQAFGLPFETRLPPVTNGTLTPRPTSSIRLITFTPTPTVDVASLRTVENVFKNWMADQLQLLVQIGSASDNIQLTSSQRVMLSKGWQVRIYQRQPDENYRDEKALVLKDIKYPQEPNISYTFFVETTMEELQRLFNDRRDLIYQVVNGQGNVIWQEDLYLSNNLVLAFAEKEFSVGLGGGGVVVGSPNLLSQDNSIFIHQGKFITVIEPVGGFYELSYTFDLLKVTNITATSELETLARELIIRIFPYQENSNYRIENAYMIPAKEYSSSVGLYRVDFPIKWLTEAVKEDMRYYLRIEDKNKNIIKEEFFTFSHMPHDRQPQP
jgi:hypothetical protein